MKTNSSIALNRNSNVTFNDNKATFGGAVHLISCKSVFKGQSVLTFINNTATIDGGAAYYHDA